MLRIRGAGYSQHEVLDMGEIRSGAKARKGLTYAGSGVDVSAEGRAIRSLIDSLTFQRKGIGRPVDIGAHFTGLIDFGDRYLSLCTDGVGSKMLIAEEMGKWDTVGIDCMAMNVNDMICVGAEPLSFVDYLAAHGPSEGVLSEIGKGLNEGARRANVSIIGGETASLPDMVKGYDLAGTCLGHVRKDEVITGASIKEGDVIIGLRSSGVHSNGYSLVRRIMRTNRIGYDLTLEELVEASRWNRVDDGSGYKGCVEAWARKEPGLTIGLALLEPTRIYVKDVLSMLGKVKKGSVHGLAHITGGGLRNLVRLKKGVSFLMDRPLQVPPVFRMLQLLGRVSEAEMYSTFNMGMGFALVVESEVSEMVRRSMKGAGAKEVGHISKGSGVHLNGAGLSFDGYI